LDLLQNSSLWAHSKRRGFSPGASRATGVGPEFPQILAAFFPISPVFYFEIGRLHHICLSSDHICLNSDIVSDVVSDIASPISERGDVRSQKRSRTKKGSLKSRREKIICINPWGLWPDHMARRDGLGAKAPRLAARPSVASSPGSLLPHLPSFDAHRKLVGCSAIPARSCLGPVVYTWGSIVELEVPPEKTPGLMTLHPPNTNVLQSTRMLSHHTHLTYSIWDKKSNAFDTSMASPSRLHNFAAGVSHR